MRPRLRSRLLWRLAPAAAIVEKPGDSRYLAPGAVPFRHGLSFPNESEENCCNFLKICYHPCPYGYSKEKCILPSGSRSGN